MQDNCETNKSTQPNKLLPSSSGIYEQLCPIGKRIEGIKG